MRKWVMRPHRKMEREHVAGQIESNFFILIWLTKESRSDFAVV
jgi:hypothetical protein